MRIFGASKPNDDLKKKADELIIKGNWSKALSEYQKIVDADPTNIRNRQKLADIYAKLNKNENAITEYTQVAEGYATEGFLIKAIAINKLIMKLDPQNKDVQEKLANLYSCRGLEYKDIKKSEATGKKERSEEVEKCETVPKIPLFSDLSHEEFCNVVSKLQEKQFFAGSIICREGEKGDSIFVISEGEVSITRKNSMGQDVSLAKLTDGAFFGEFAFFSNAERHATVIADKDTLIFEITKDAIEGIIKEFPRVNQVLFDFYKERVILNILAMSPIFQHCTPEERKEIMNKFERRNFAQNEVIIDEGELGDSIFLIKSGKVQIFTKKDNKNIELAKLNAGEFFGEIALLTGRPRTATVTALTAAELLELKKRDFDAILAKHPEISSVLQAYLQDRAKKTANAIINFEREEQAKNKLV